jgi:hypothetical protein
MSIATSFRFRFAPGAAVLLLLLLLVVVVVTVMDAVIA